MKYHWLDKYINTDNLGELVVEFIKLGYTPEEAGNFVEQTIDIEEELLDKFNNIGCTSFQFDIKI